MNVERKRSNNSNEEYISRRDAVRLYLVEVRSKPQITQKEVIEFAMIKDAGHEARDNLYEGNLRRVLPIVKEFTDQGLTTVQLIEVGNRGLMLAIKKYEWEKHGNFKMYSAGVIHRHITNAIEEDHHPELMSFEDILGKDEVKNCKNKNALLPGYFLEIEKKPVWTEEQEIDFARKKEAGFDATKKLVEGNLKFVVWVVKRSIGRGVSFESLIQVGNIGLMNAADKYDYKRGTKFSTYAIWWIRQAVEYAILEQSGGILDTPTNQLRDINKYIKAKQSFPEETVRNDVLEVLFNRSIISLDTPLTYDGYSDDLHDVTASKDPGPDVISDTNILNGIINKGLERLNERERFVIIKRFGPDSMTLQEIGQLLNGISREMVRQIEAKALGKLRHDEGLREAAKAFGT